VCCITTQVRWQCSFCRSQCTWYWHVQKSHLYRYDSTFLLHSPHGTFYLYIYIYIYLLLSKRYNSCRVLAFSTIFFHSWRSWACSVHLRSFVFLRSFLTSSSHLCLGLPTGRVIYGCHLCIFFTVLVSGFLYMCPYQLNLWALT